jgi:hypothetical protein
MRFEEYRRFDAVALAGLLKKGELSAGELLDMAIARAEAGTRRFAKLPPIFNRRPPNCAR